MNLAVKIFIVLNLVMCVVFAAVQMNTYATSENYKKRWDQDTKKLQEDVKDATKLASEKGVEFERAKNRIVDLETLIGDKTAEIAKLGKDLATADGNIKALNETIRRNETNFNALNDSYISQGQSLEKVRQRMSELNHIAQVSRAAAFQVNVKLAEVEDDLNNEVAKNTKLMEENDASKKKISQQEAFIAFIRDNFPEQYKAANTQGQGAIPVNAVVTFLKTDPQGRQDTVILSVGQSQLQPGAELLIHRGSMFLVKVRVYAVNKDSATCRVIPETWNSKQTAIQIGDLAMTAH